MIAGDGLGEVVIHAGFEAERTILSGDAGGESDDGRAASGAFEAADLPGGFKAVHIGHLDIHEDEVEGRAMESGESLNAAGSGVYLAAEFFEE